MRPLKRIRTVSEALMGRNPIALVVPLIDVLAAHVLPRISPEDRVALRRVSQSHYRVDSMFCPPHALQIRYNALHGSDAGDHVAHIYRQLALIGWDWLPIRWQLSVDIDEGIHARPTSEPWLIIHGESVNILTRTYLSARLVVGWRCYGIRLTYDEATRSVEDSDDSEQYEVGHLSRSSNSIEPLSAVLHALPRDYAKFDCQWSVLGSAIDKEFPGDYNIF
jgi:hypothetical protein